MRRPLGNERAAIEAATSHTRLVLMRSAMTMSPDRGGVFDTLLRLVRCGLGGKHGDGQQFVSWVHERDFVRAIYWLMEHDELSGAVNIASPHPLPNAEFLRQLRHAWGARVGLPAARWMLEIGTFFLRSESELVLKSRRVVPRRLLESGFEFEYPTWDLAASELCTRWREWQQAKHSEAPAITAHVPAPTKPRGSAA
jgi:NAD dependent epimerase/dehydratase family enzyme